MSAARLLDEVRAAVAVLRHEGRPLRCDVDAEGAVSVYAPNDLPIAERSAWTSAIVQALPPPRFHTRRSRTLVRVTREPVPPRGAPDFVQRRTSP